MSSVSAFLWQLMRYNMLQLLKNLRSHAQGKEIKDKDILRWANRKIKSSGRTSEMGSFKDKSLSNGLFFLELLSSVEPRVVNWNLVTKGESVDQKRLNAIYIISVARKLGCSIFLLPEDIIQVNHKMILTLTASIMYWSLQQGAEELDMCPSPSDTTTTTSPNTSPAPSICGEDYSSFSGEVSSLTFDDGVILDDASSETAVSSRPINQDGSFSDYEVFSNSTVHTSSSNGIFSSRAVNVSISDEGSTLTVHDGSYLDSDPEVESSHVSEREGVASVNGEKSMVTVYDDTAPDNELAPSEVVRKQEPASVNGNGSTLTADHASDTEEAEVSSYEPHMSG